MSPARASDELERRLSVPRKRIACRAVLLDAGGVVVLPDRHLVTDALARVGIEIDPSAVADAHYRTVRRLDREAETGGPRDGYLQTLCSTLGVRPERLPDAVSAMSYLADRSLSGAILWSERAPQAQRTIAALQRAGVAVVVVTNSDGHAADNLRDAGICHTGPGPGVRVTGVVDSALVGSAKPDPEIFRIALRRARVRPESAVHVGDMLGTDVAGARSAGIVPIHLDPHRTCRATDHRHIRALNGIWRHVALSVD
jgi:putative hydrolase of the HAD superfamily